MALLALLEAAIWPSHGSAGVTVWPTEGRQVYRLALAKASPNQRMILGTTYDERLCCWDESGAHRWDAPAGGFVFDVCCGDLDGDGADEILTAGADGAVRCFSIAGKELWRHSMEAPVLQVAVARLDGKSPVVLAGGITRQIVMLSPEGQATRTVDMSFEDEGEVVVRVLRAGDFDGDGSDEVALVGVRSKPLYVRFFKGADLEPMPGATSQLGKFASGDDPVNGLAADVDGDGAAELLLAGDIVGFKDGSLVHRTDVLPAVPKPKSYCYSYRMRTVAVGDLAPGPGCEILALDGADLQLCSADGKPQEAACAPLGFTDALYLPGSPLGTILLGSGTGGDDNLYRVAFDGDWKRALENLPRSGRQGDLDARLAKVAEAAATWEGAPMAGADGPYDVMVRHYMMTSRAALERVDDMIAEVRLYEKAFPYPRLRFSTCFWPCEQGPLLRPDGQEWPHDKRLKHDMTRADLVGLATKLEQARCHFWVQVGHGCSPHCSVEAVKAMLDAAPTMCLGFISAEDEKPEDIAYYFQHHIVPILELCLERGKRFIPRDKNVWWCYWPANPELRRMIFNGRYRSVLLPCVEDSNSRTADAQLAARVGLWLDGQVDDWASRCSADWFNCSRTWEWESVLTGHPQLRYYVSQAMLGARVFLNLNGELDKDSNWTPVGAQGTAPFLHMLGRGLITPPRREQIKSISPVVLNIPNPSERFVHHGANGHNHHQWNADGSESQSWAFDRLDCYWAMAPLPPTDVSTYLWGRTRRSADHLAVTAPNGFVCLLPGPAPHAGGPWTTVWTTDGDSLSRDERAIPLEEAREQLLQDLAAGEARAPIHVEGRVFHQVIEEGPNHYVVALVDPGWLDPADREAKVTIRLPGTWSVRDRLDGQALGTPNGPLSVTVPGGTLRILEIRSK